MEKIKKRLQSPSELYLQVFSEAKHEFTIKYKYEYIHNIHRFWIDYIHINVNKGSKVPTFRRFTFHFLFVIYSPRTLNIWIMILRKNKLG